MVDSNEKTTSSNEVVLRGFLDQHIWESLRDRQTFPGLVAAGSTIAESTQPFQMHWYLAALVVAILATKFG